MAVSATGIPDLPPMPQSPGEGADSNEWIQYQAEMQKWSIAMNAITKAMETKHQAESSAVNRANANIR